MISSKSHRTLSFSRHLVLAATFLLPVLGKHLLVKTGICWSSGGSAMSPQHFNYKGNMGTFLNMSFQSVKILFACKLSKLASTHIQNWTQHANASICILMHTVCTWLRHSQSTWLRHSQSRNKVLYSQSTLFLWPQSVVRHRCGVSDGNNGYARHL